LTNPSIPSYPTPSYFQSAIYTYVDNDTSVVFEVQEDTVSTAPRLALTDNDSGHNLLSQFRLTLLDRADDHVTGSSSGESVKTTLNTADSDDVKVL
jgi:hypothetical protein